MRIITTVTTWRLSGVNTFNINLVREIRKRGLDAEILVTDPHAPVPAPLPKPKDVPVHALWPGGETAKQDRKDALIGYIRSQAPCIILANDITLSAADRERLGASVHLIGIIHNDTEADIRFAQALARSADAIVAVSDHIVACIAKKDPNLASRIMAIPHGIPLPDVRPRRSWDGPLHVVYAGRLAQEQKRVLDVVAAVAAAHGMGADIQLTVAGAGTQRGIMEALARSALPPERTEFVGALSPEAVSDLFARAHVNLLTCDYEGFGLSLLEGMAQGCVPVVSHIDAGYRTFVRAEETGLLVSPGDVRGFGAALYRLDKDRSMLKAISGRCIDAAQSYGTAGMCDAYIALFKRLGAPS